jgi:hypothetical protein
MNTLKNLFALRSPLWRMVCGSVLLTLPVAAHAQYSGPPINHNGTSSHSGGYSNSNPLVISEPISITPRLAVLESTGSVPVQMPQLVLVIQRARKSLILQKGNLIAAFAPTTGGTNNISTQQFQALQSSLQHAQDAAERVESGATTLASQQSAVPTSTLNTNLSATAGLRSALMGLVQQLKALPRNGTPAQRAAVSASVDVVAEMTVFLETLAPALQKTRDQALLKISADDVKVAPVTPTADK